MVRFEKFKNWEKATVKQDIFTTGKFREPRDFRENREIFLHAKISCFTVLNFDDIFINLRFVDEIKYPLL